MNSFKFYDVYVSVEDAHFNGTQISYITQIQKYETTATPNIHPPHSPTVPPNPNPSFGQINPHKHNIPDSCPNIDNVQFRQDNLHKQMYPNQLRQ